MTFYCDARRHLVCVPYSRANLHHMATLLKIARCWFHRGGRGGTAEHYDIPKQRYDEIRAKCVLVSEREILRITKGEPASPESENA